MNAAETALLERLKEPRLVRHAHPEPPDGGDTLDTYEGWKRRGYQVVKGARAIIPRRCTREYNGPIFDWHSVSPLTSKPPAARPLKAGEDDLHL